MNQIFKPADLSDAMSEPELPRKNRVRIGRRGFLSTGAAAGGGLLIGLSLIGSAEARRKSSSPPPADPTPTPTDPTPTTPVTTATVNVFVVIGSDNSITLITPGAEMGQGINAGLAQVLGEELSFDWSILKTVSAPYGPQYGRGASKSQVTGGSFNMRGWFTLMLQAGATAREMLLEAARVQFSLPTGTPLKAELGVVKDSGGNILATYGQLAATASTLVVPSPSPLLSATTGYQVVGKRLPRPDIKLKVDGSAIFGIDVRVPGMVHAAVRHCPTLGGTVASMGSPPTGSQAINLGDAVAVTGPNTWAAIKAANGLSVSWNLPSESTLASVDTSSLSSQAKSLMTSATPIASGGTLAVAEQVGGITAGMAAASKKLTLTYSLPFFAHACMEVLNCTVQLTRDGSTITDCHIWCPTQAPDWVARTAAALTGITDMNRIAVTTTYLGGGLGLKIEQHYVKQAIQVAMELNAPVKLTWPREEDFARDWMRPSALSRVQVGLDAGGAITAWSNRIVSPSLSRSHGGSPRNGVDGISVGHATGLPYAMSARLVEYVEQTTGMRIGYWRSVGESISCFVVESAIDECALAAGVEPLAYRRVLLAGKTAELEVLNAAAALAGWGTPPAAGRARGIALSSGFGSLAATVAELALTSTGAVQIARICVAVDCGFAVNPDEVEAQIEGGVMHGLSSARWSKMQFDHGIAQVKNFGDYRLSQMSDAPQIDVAIVNQGSALCGIGEVGVPGVAPALANAYAALTGTRKRNLPLGF